MTINERGGRREREGEKERHRERETEGGRNRQRLIAAYVSHSAPLPRLQASLRQTFHREISGASWLKCCFICRFPRLSKAAALSRPRAPCPHPHLSPRSGAEQFQYFPTFHRQRHRNACKYSAPFCVTTTLLLALLLRLLAMSVFKHRRLTKIDIGLGAALLCLRLVFSLTWGSFPNE